MIAELRPQPSVPATIRKIRAPYQPPAPKPDTYDAADVRAAPALTPETPNAVLARPIVAPLATERYKVQFTITRATRDQLRGIQALMRHSIPDGDVAEIFARALSLLLHDLQRKRLAATANPREQQQTPNRSRHIPSAVKREVWRRDGGQCAFVGSNTRCPERGFLEFHHRMPYAAGGGATVENIELRCRAHNAYEATLFFGRGGEEVAREVSPPWG